MLITVYSQPFSDIEGHLIQRHLQLCTRFVSRAHNLEHFKDTLAALQAFIPSTFSHNSSTPCWYAELSISPVLSQNLTGRIRDTLPQIPMWYTKEEALQVVESVRANESPYSNRTLMCLPSVYVSGFQKCGSTALYDLITAHPQVAPPRWKEGHFWRTVMQTDSQPYKSLQVLHYLFHLKPAADMIERNPRGITLDASTSTVLAGLDYERSENSDACIIPSILSKILPEAKYILIMRNPVDRLWSDYWYFCAEGWRQSGRGGRMTIPKEYLQHGPEIFHNHTLEVIAEFNTCMNDEHTPEFECVRRVSFGQRTEYGCEYARVGIGLYYYHIVNWMSTIARKRFLFLKSEDLYVNPFHEMVKVWKFLGLQPLNREWVGIGHSNANQWIKSKKYRNTFQIMNRTHEVLTSFYRPYNKRLARLLNDSRFVWSDDG